MADSAVPSPAARWGRPLLASPEVNVVLFAFLLHFVWEMWQAPFFAGVAKLSHWEALVNCTRHTAGDAVIALASFSAVALAWRDRDWILRPRVARVVGFIAAGLLITVGLEWHATEIADRWSYAEHMPVLPVLGTGLAPLLQWILLPPLIVWLVRRQLLGYGRSP